MATGPEHFRVAERLIQSLKTASGAVYIESGNEQVSAIAQVHATLALAAATRDAGIPRGHVLAERCNIAESAHGRQCGKPMDHTGTCDFTAGGGV